MNCRSRWEIVAAAIALGTGRLDAIAIAYFYDPGSAVEAIELGRTIG